MDEVRSLLVRNAELQTELRLVREQLSQANNANTYILQRLSSIGEDGENDEHREESQFRNLLALTRSRRSVGFKKIRTGSAARGLERKSKTTGEVAGSRSRAYAESSGSEDEDLLSFDEVHREDSSVADVDDAPISKQASILDDFTAEDLLHGESSGGHTQSAQPVVSQTVSSGKLTQPFASIHHAPQAPRNHGNRREAQNMWSFGRPVGEAEQDSAWIEIPPWVQQRHQGFNFTHPDGTSIRTAGAPPLTDAPPAYVPPQPSRPFAVREHNHLMGLATFIEDMDAEQQAQKWVEIAQEFSQRTAAEYEAYYKETVRPKYLENMQQRQAKASLENPFTSTSAVQTSSTEHVQQPRIEDSRDADVSFASTIAVGPESSSQDCVAGSQCTSQEALACESPLLASQGTIVGGGLERCSGTIETQVAPVNDLVQPSFVGVIGKLTTKGGPVQPGHKIQNDGDNRQAASVETGTTSSISAWKSFASGKSNLADRRDSVHPQRLPSSQVEPATSKSGLAASIHADQQIDIRGAADIGEARTCAGESRASATAPLQADTHHEAHLDIERLQRIPGYRGTRANFPLRGPYPDGPRGGSHEHREWRRGPRFGPQSFEHIQEPRTFPVDETELFAHSDDPRTRRTVLITNIPINITLSDVLDKVKGGKILSAHYAATAGMRTQPYMETNSVLVVFLVGRDAADFVRYSNEKKFLFFYSKKWEAPFKATATILDSPSRPISLAVQRDIGVTRVVFLHGVPPQVSDQELVDELALRHPNVKKPLKSGLDEDGIMFFEFASMNDASAAWKALGIYFNGSVNRGFLRDPCDMPLDCIPNAVYGEEDETDQESEAADDMEEPKNGESEGPSEMKSPFQRSEAEETAMMLEG
ncbi:Hypothetical predicted protein [Lecanosticta acicola]|uniref:Uncharacterized protein n=1 Tax=Lecanosticta acicola TaxID=111012 RepID=A0AAI8YYW2_9PEZI|nr:Hypothetical predicted protein [Lecanosticta acicola]